MTRAIHRRKCQILRLPLVQEGELQSASGGASVAQFEIRFQQDFWNEWNASTREQSLDEVSHRQADVVCGWLQRLERRDLAILEVGCGAGWFCHRLSDFGRVTGTDLSDHVLERARQKMPDATFVAGDFMQLEFPPASYDVVVSLEVLAHVADQRAFVSKLASLLRPGGLLMMATQNAPVLRRHNRLPPPAPGQLRRWIDKHELRDLLSAEFEVRELFSVTPRANRGLMRWVHSRAVNRPIRAVVGNRVDRLKEALGLGWTLMVLARRRGAEHAYEV